MTKVFFVRHAEPNYDNHDDRSRELSPRGMKLFQVKPDKLEQFEAKIEEMTAKSV